MASSRLLRPSRSQGTTSNETAANSGDPSMADKPPVLLGSYSTPAFRLGDRVHCLLRGEVEIVCLSSGSIPWPVGRNLPRGRQRFLIVYGDLAEAIRRESASAVSYWWGVGMDTVWRWR